MIQERKTSSNFEANRVVPMVEMKNLLILSPRSGMYPDMSGPASAPRLHRGGRGEMYTTYIIESEVTAKWYYGHSEDIIRRLDDHNQNRNKSTSKKGPWKLIFIRSFETKVEANRFELLLKRLRNKNYMKKKYAVYFLKNDV